MKWQFVIAGIFFTLAWLSSYLSEPERIPERLCFVGLMWITVALSEQRS